MSNGPEITPLASPPTSEPWVPLWPLQPSALGELAYAETDTKTTTATSTGTAGVIVTAPAFTLAEATRVVIEFYAPQVDSTPAFTLSIIDAYAGATSTNNLGIIGRCIPQGNAFYCRREILLTAGTHAVQIRAWITAAGTLSIAGGAGGAAANIPLSLRVSLAAPIMPHVAGAALPVSYGTSLPGGPLDGQEAILVDSVTNPTYRWRFRYNAGSSSAYKWEFVGGAAAYRPLSTGELLPTASWQGLASGPKVIVPRGGVYTASFSASFTSNVAPTTTAVAMAINGVIQYPSEAVDSNPTAGSSIQVSQVDVELPAVGAGDTLSHFYYSAGAGVTTVSRRHLRILPVGVS